MKCCPTCGREFGPKIRVGGRKRQALFDIVARYPDGVSTDRIADHLYADDPNGGPDDTGMNIRSQVAQLNKILAQHGLHIRATGGPGSVYRLQSASEPRWLAAIQKRKEIAATPGSERAVATRFGVSKTSVARWRRKYGTDLCAS